MNGSGLRSRGAVIPGCNLSVSIALAKDGSPQHARRPPLALPAVFKRAFQRLYGPVDPRHPEAYPAWRRLLTPIMFFRCVSEDGVAAWLHNVACRPLLAQAAIVRVPLTYACFWLGALTAPWSAVASLPFWIIMLVCAIQAFVYAVIWAFLGKKDVEYGDWD